MNSCTLFNIDLWSGFFGTLVGAIIGGLIAFFIAKIQIKSQEKGLSKEYYKQKNNENIFPFSANLASLEIFQFISISTGSGGVTDLGTQRFRYDPGIISQYFDRKCSTNCDFVKSIACGDKFIKVFD